MALGASAAVRIGARYELTMVHRDVRGKFAISYEIVDQPALARRLTG